MRAKWILKNLIHIGIVNEHVWPLDVFHGGRTGLEHLAPTVANSVRIPLPSIFRRFSGAAIYSGSGALGFRAISARLRFGGFAGGLR